MFWVIIVSLCGGAAVFLLAPRLLGHGAWQVRRPRLALTLWFGAIAVGSLLVSAAIAGALLNALALAPADGPLQALVLTCVAWFGLGALGAGAASAMIAAEPMRLAARRAAVEAAPVAVSREPRRGFTLVQFRSAELVACAVPGRRPEILLSTAVERLLTPAQLEAVLAHEFAHLRHHHGLALRISELNARVLKWSRGAREMHRAVRLLVELDADDTAARQAGAVHLANALVRLGDGDDEEGMVLRAERLAQRRWPKASRRRLPVALRETSYGAVAAG